MVREVPHALDWPSRVRWHSSQLLIGGQSRGAGRSRSLFPQHRFVNCLVQRISSRIRRPLGGTRLGYLHLEEGLLLLSSIVQVDVCD